MFKHKRNKLFWLFSIGVLVFFTSLLLAFSLPVEAKPKGHLVVLVDLGQGMTGGDGLTSREGGAVAINYTVHEGLVMPVPGKPNLNWKPALAKSWEFSPDYKTLKFTLNEKAKFHNGAPVTAEDVKFTYERAKRPELKNIYGPRLRAHISKIEVIDKLNGVFHLRWPSPLFMDRYSDYICIIPKAYTEKVGDEGFAKHPIGAGPFKWVDFEQNTFVKLEAFEEYYGKVPNVKTLEIKFKMEPSTAIAMLKTGEADISFITAAHLDEVVKNPNLKVKWDKYGLGLSIIYPDLRYPDKKSPWHDKRVRQAALYAINKEAISKDVHKGVYEPYGDIVAPYQVGYDPSVKPYPYDPIKAKALLSEAGYANGFDMTLTASILENVTVQAVAADLRKVGIRAKIEILDVGTFVNTIFAKKIKPGLYIDLTPFWAGERHPGLSLGSCADPRVPFVYYIPKEITRAYEKLGGTFKIQDIEAQAKVVSRLFQEYMPRGVIFAKHRVWGIGPRVESWETVEGYFAISGLNYVKIKD